MIADFRSDTLTIPTREMLNSMMAARVGDDVWEEDPTVIELEKKMAAMFGMETGLFCPSGTMANQIAIRIHTRQQDEVICDYFSHINHYEAGGPASNSQVSLKLVKTEKGILSANDISKAINPVDVHFPPSRLVVLENTCNKGGGYSYAFEGLREIREISHQKDLTIHIDGARIFNATTSQGYSPLEIGRICDSISICLSKGLGCPVGTVLLFKDKEQLFFAKRVRKAFGGGMRQAGYLAAAGLFALENNIDRLEEDHRRAKEIGKIISKQGFCEDIKEVETNIVLFRSNIGSSEFIQKLKNKGILVAGMGDEWIRFVTYLGIEDDHIQYFSEVAARI